MSYGISSRDYLGRARQRLADGCNESLFYAAFEIRCGVEARMLEYLEVQKHVSKKKRQGWQVAKLARNIENVFRIGEKDTVLRIINKYTNELEFEARYTPVKSPLKKAVEKFGNYLHSAKKHHPDDSEFWNNFRKELDIAACQLEVATSGRLLGPLLMHPNKKNIDVKLELPTKKEQEIAKSFTIGKEAILQVSYD